MKCPSGKRIYHSKQLAEDALLELWSKNDYKHGGPINIYQCEDCGNFHMTSKGLVNNRLAQYLSDNRSRIDKEANRWLDKIKHKH